jgi:hypothetical protein
MTDAPDYQIGVDELRKLDADTITDALRAGRLDQLLAGHDPGPPPKPDHGDDDEDFVTRYARQSRGDQHDTDHDETRQLGRDDLRTMSESELAAALENGQLDELLGRKT